MGAKGGQRSSLHSYLASFYWTTSPLRMLRFRDSQRNEKGYTREKQRNKRGEGVLWGPRVVKGSASAGLPFLSKLVPLDLLTPEKEEEKQI